MSKTMSVRMDRHNYQFLHEMGTILLLGKTRAGPYY